jgi:hypothetical protein
VGYIELGEMEQAATFFNKSWLPYVDRKTGDFGGTVPPPPQQSDGRKTELNFGGAVLSFG